MDEREFNMEERKGTGERIMLITASHLRDFRIQATDGELGTVGGLYFEDDTWAIRYLLVNTGGWLNDRSVLVSPFSVVHIDSETKHMEVSLTKEQVEKSPDIDTQRPVSRQQEANFLGYYGYPYYWGGPNLWGAGCYPGDSAMQTSYTKQVAVGNRNGQPYDSHLRSTDAVIGYDIDTVDGNIGHVDGFVIEEKSWAIRYLEIATRNWLPGKKVLISPAWIERISWLDSKVSLALVREAVKAAPEYIESRPITREYEEQLHSHYGQPPYWLHEGKPALILSDRDHASVGAAAPSAY